MAGRAVGSLSTMRISFARFGSPARRSRCHLRNRDSTPTAEHTRGDARFPRVYEQHGSYWSWPPPHGWDSNIYRAAYLLAPGHYKSEEVSQFVAHVALLALEVLSDDF